MPLRRSIASSYSPYPLRSARRRSSYVEIDDDADSLREFKSSLFRYPVAAQITSFNLLCFDRETKQVKEFPYPTDANERPINPDGFNAYFDYRRLAFECFCGFVTPGSTPNFVTATVVNRVHKLCCSKCSFNVPLNLIRLSATKRQFYMIPKDKTQPTRPITSSMIMVREVAALPGPQYSGIQDSTQASQSGTTSRQSQASSSKASSSTSNAIRWEICPICDHTYREGGFRAHRRFDCFV